MIDGLLIENIVCDLDGDKSFCEIFWIVIM